MFKFALFFFIVLPTIGFASESTESKTEKVSSYDNLRKRQHRLSWDYGTTNSEIEIDGFSDSDTDSTNLSIEYGYNLGQFEIGGALSSGSTDSGDDETSTAITLIYGRFNFIENTPGNDYVPYLAFGLVGYAEEGEVSSTDYDAEGSGQAIILGITIFPLGEIFAVEVSYGLADISGDVDFVGSGEYDFDLVRKGLSVGFSLYY